MKKKIILSFLIICVLLSACTKVVEPAEESCPAASSGPGETEHENDSSQGEEPVEIAEEAPPFTVQEAAEMEAGTILTAEQIEEAGMEHLFYAQEIPDEVFQRMEGVSYGEGCVVAREELRYVRVLHTGFDGETHIGELVVNQEIAEDIVEIFQELYKASYPIEKMRLVDEYGGDDEASMADNNTSAFNFRVVSGTDRISRHGYGMAIDINPLYNPYINSAGYQPANAGDYVDRSGEIPYRIDEGDLCWTLFTERGFTWGGSWTSVKDYQHFEK